MSEVVKTRMVRRKRIAEILSDLNKSGQVHVNDYVARWLSSRSYVRDLFRTIAIAYHTVQLTDDGDTLILKKKTKTEKGAEKE